MNEYVSRVGNSKYTIKFSESNSVFVNGSKFEYSLKKISTTNYVISINKKSLLCSVIENKNSSFEININGNSFRVKSHSLIADKAEELIKDIEKTASVGIIVKAPMPGLILKIKKQNGDNVERGETVMILEAMKMENEIRAPISGKIFFNSIKEGSGIEKNTKLFEIL
ncbi:acetyl-CoA carboxylase biotin carboxyl carrier protein subunit [Ignavibacterium sp.]|uniref:acetyl-CoA carboxylase biotin carboxyl carrier protein subunit n=1 Tax=Ignavibacterium sp. TaxID=2651167 RepID=UPI00307E2939